MPMPLQESWGISRPMGLDRGEDRVCPSMCHDEGARR
jgi:hypothetical protein